MGAVEGRFGQGEELVPGDEGVSVVEEGHDVGLDFLCSLPFSKGFCGIDYPCGLLHAEIIETGSYLKVSIIPKRINILIQIRNLAINKFRFSLKHSKILHTQSARSYFLI